MWVFSCLLRSDFLLILSAITEVSRVLQSQLHMSEDFSLLQHLTPFQLLLHNKLPPHLVAYKNKYFIIVHNLVGQRFGQVSWPFNRSYSVGFSFWMGQCLRAQNLPPGMRPYSEQWPCIRLWELKAWMKIRGIQFLFLFCKTALVKTLHSLCVFLSVQIIFLSWEYSSLCQTHTRTFI